MKAYINVLIVAAMAMSVAACTVEPYEMAEGYSKTVSFKIDEPQTKSSITPSLSNFWAEGDQIGVFCEQTNPQASNASYTAKAISDELYFYSNTDYQWGNETDYHTFSIYYPYRSNVTNEVYHGTLPSTQTATSDGGVSVTGGTVVDNNFLYTKITCRKTYDGLVPIKDMKRQFGIIEFQVICNDPSWSDASISRARFYPENDIPCGDYSFDLNNGTIRWGATTTDCYQVNVSGLKCSSVHNAKRSVYMLVPAGTSIYGNYVVTIGGKDYAIERKGSDQKTIEAGEFYTVTFLSNDLKQDFTNRFWIIAGAYSDRTFIYCTRSEMYTGHYLLPGDLIYNENTNTIYVIDRNWAVYDKSVPITDETTGVNSGIIRYGYDGGTIEYSLSSLSASVSIDGEYAESYYEWEDWGYSNLVWSRNFSQKCLTPNNVSVVKGKIRQPANCHIVENETVFFFRPTMGSSQTLAGQTSWLYEGSADIIWQQAYDEADGPVITEATMHDQQLLDDFCIDNNYRIYCDPLIEIHAGAKGNAVVGLYHSGLVWSWHIWAPHDPLLLYSSTFGDLMSCNLGQDVYITTDKTTEGKGLFYQWGRKDPFTYPNEARDGLTQTYSTNKPSTGFGSWLIAHPEDMSQRYYFGIVTNGIWGNRSNTKSLQDPCPAGWRVPSPEDIEAVYNGFGHYQRSADWPGDSIYGFDFGGYVESGVLKGTDTGAYWLAIPTFPISTTSRAALRIVPGSSTGYWQPTYVSLNDFDESNGAHVRCVRYNENAE